MKNSPTAVAFQSFVAGWLIEKWRRQKDVNVLAGQQVPLDDGAPGAVVRVLQEQEHLRAFFFFSFFPPVIIYTPEKARQTHGCVWGEGGGGGFRSKKHTEQV